MGKLYNTFEFVGNLAIPKNKDKFHSIKQSDSGWDLHRLNFGIQESKLNTAFLELFGGVSKNKPMKVFGFSKGLFGEKGSNIEIKWEDRGKEEIKDMVADFAKIIVDLETDQEKKKEYMRLYYKIRSLENKKDASDEDKEKLKQYKAEFKELATNRYEFLHEYDAIQFLEEMLEVNKDKKFRVTGNIQWNEWKGKYYRKFIPKLIEIVDNDTRNKLQATIDIFFDKNCVDKSLFKDEKKVFINGYIQDYVREEKADRFFPQSFVINGTNIDFENELHMNRFKFITDSFKIRGREYHHMQYLTSIYRGAEQVDFTYDDLTQQQKEAIDLGLNKLEDFAPKGGFLGNNIEEIRIIKPILKGDFKEGAVSTGYTEEDFIELIVKDTSDVNLDDIKEEKKEEDKKADEQEKQEDEDLNDMLDTLFS